MNKKICFITDSASDMGTLKLDHVKVLPMEVAFGQEIYKDGIDLTHQEFYEKLIESDELPKTSQVGPLQFSEAIQEVLNEGEIPVIVTISSKLSGTYQSAMIAASDFENEVYVIDSENVTVGQCALIHRGIQLEKQGYSALEVVERLEKEKKQIHLVGLLETLEYLKKGGRISKSAALAGSLLSIKPVIGIVNGEVEVLGKARGSKQGNNLLMQEVEKAGGIDFQRPIFLGYTGLYKQLIEKYINDSASLWESKTEKLDILTVGATIGTHIGPGAIALAFFADAE